MRVVVGGPAKKSGKTSLVVAILRAFPQLEWTAVKVSSHAHARRTEGTDTARFLEAGARRSLLLRDDGEPSFVDRLLTIADESSNLLVESNIAASLLRQAQPDVTTTFLMTLGSPAIEAKPSAVAAVVGADAFVAAYPQQAHRRPTWISEEIWMARPRFALDHERALSTRLSRYLLRQTAS